MEVSVLADARLYCRRTRDLTAPAPGPPATLLPPSVERSVQTGSPEPLSVEMSVWADLSDPLAATVEFRRVTGAHKPTASKPGTV